MGGVFLLILVGFFGKGVIHYAIAKIFGPLIRGRGFCNKVCPMGIDVMSYIKNKKVISDTECIHCRDCTVVCPVNAV